MKCETKFVANCETCGPEPAGTSRYTTFERAEAAAKKHARRTDHTTWPTPYCIVHKKGHTCPNEVEAVRGRAYAAMVVRFARSVRDAVPQDSKDEVEALGQEAYAVATAWLHANNDRAAAWERTLDVLRFTKHIESASIEAESVEDALNDFATFALRDDIVAAVEALETGDAEAVAHAA